MNNNRYISPDEIKAAADQAFADKARGLYERLQPTRYANPADAELHTQPLQKSTQPNESTALTETTLACVLASALSDDDVYYVIEQGGAQSINKAVSTIKREQVNAPNRRKNMLGLIMKGVADPYNLSAHEIALINSLNTHMIEGLENNFNRVHSNFIERAARYFMGDATAAEEGEVAFVPRLTGLRKGIAGLLEQTSQFTDADKEIAKAVFCEALEDLVYSDQGYLLEVASFNSDAPMVMHPDIVAQAQEWASITPAEGENGSPF